MDRFSRKYDGTNKTVSHRWKGKERPSHYHGASGLILFLCLLCLRNSGRPCGYVAPSVARYICPSVSLRKQVSEISSRSFLPEWNLLL